MYKRYRIPGLQSDAVCLVAERQGAFLHHPFLTVQKDRHRHSADADESAAGRFHPIDLSPAKAVDKFARRAGYHFLARYRHTSAENCPREQCRHLTHTGFLRCDGAVAVHIHLRFARLYRYRVQVVLHVPCDRAIRTAVHDERCRMRIGGGCAGFRPGALRDHLLHGGTAADRIRLPVLVPGKEQHRYLPGYTEPSSRLRLDILYAYIPGCPCDRHTLPFPQISFRRRRMACRGQPHVRDSLPPQHHGFRMLSDPSARRVLTPRCKGLHPKPGGQGQPTRRRYPAGYIFEIPDDHKAVLRGEILRQRHLRTVRRRQRYRRDLPVLTQIEHRVTDVSLLQIRCSVPESIVRRCVTHDSQHPAHLRYIIRQGKILRYLHGFRARPPRYTHPLLTHMAFLRFYIGLEQYMRRDSGIERDDRAGIAAHCMADAKKREKRTRRRMTAIQKAAPPSIGDTAFLDYRMRPHTLFLRGRRA